MIKITIIAIVITLITIIVKNEYLVNFRPKSVFGVIKEKSNSDFIFLVIFFIFLFVPMSHISQKETSKQENRFLAKWHPLITQEGKFNYNFGNDFNEWFNDRFYLRQYFINCKNSLTFLIANKCEKGYLDSDTQTMYPIWSFGHYDMKTVKKNFEALFEFNKYCKAHNIKLYVLIVPNKADIHTTKCNFIKDDYKHRDFNYGQDCMRMGIMDSVCKIYHKYDYRYYRNKDFDNLDETIIFEKYHYGKIYNYDKAANHRIILLGTSQNESLTEFIPFCFRHVKRIRNNDVVGIQEKDEFKIISRYEKEMLDYKPEIIIFCITYENIDKLYNLFETE